MTSALLGRILVVDDEAELLAVLSEKLSHQGYHVTSCPDPREALRVLQKETFDILLTDLMMPGMDGVALVRAALQIDPHLAGIIMTGQATVQTAVEAMKIGALDYVLKPFKTPALLPVLARALELRRLRLENVQLREAAAIDELCKAIAFSTDLGAILNKIADGALQQCQAEEVSIMLPTADGQELIISAVKGPERGGLLGERVPIDQGVAGFVARTCEPLTLEGEVLDPRFSPLRPREDIQSAICMPMLVGGRLVGILNVNSTQRRQPCTLGQLKALGILASAGAAAIDGALLLGQLRESEGRYRSIFQNAVEGICRTTLTGDFHAINPAYARMLGYDSPDEFLSLAPNAGQFYENQVDRERLWRLLQEQGAVQGFEVRLVRRDGCAIWVSLNGRIVQDQSGKALFDCMVEDVTERKQAEDALRLFRTLIDRSSDAIEVIDPDTGRFLDMNESGCHSLGYSREEALAKAVTDVELLFAEQQFSWPSIVADARDAGFKILEGRRRRKDGSTFPVEMNVSFAPLNQGYLVAVVRDTSERKRDEARLRKETALSDTLLESLPGLVYLIDSRGRMVRWNRATEAITGYSAPELANMYALDLVPAEDKAQIRAKLDAVFNEGKASTEGHIQSKDGRRTPFALSGVRLQGEEGPYCIGIGLDITERKHLESQFRQAQKMEAIGQLAGGVAHDFNNLLTVINGYSEMVYGRMCADDPSRELIADIKKAGDRAASLTRQLLVFSRKQILQPRVLHLNAAVEELTKLLRRLIGEDLALAFVPGQSLGMVKVDPGQFEQALINLAVNARDAMPLGGRLTLETCNVELDGSYTREHHDVQSGRYVLLAVSDTGHGMDEATRNRIFEPFFTTKEPGKGTGLGLAMVFGFVRESGGHIQVYSEVGRGSTFKIYLPRVEESVVPGPTAEARFEIPRGSETVLLVEDEDGVRSLARLVLRSAGYVVLEAKDGQEAALVSQRHEGTIHLLVTDVVMPGMGGRQLADLLATARQDMKTLFVSGYTDDAVVRHGVLEEGVHFLQKPYTATGLATKVREVLDG